LRAFEKSSHLDLDRRSSLGTIIAMAEQMWCRAPRAATVHGIRARPDSVARPATLFV
jgi:hypothetical protein